MVSGWYRVTVVESGTLTVYSTGSTDVYGYLLSSSGSELASNDDGGENRNFRISHSVSAGTYYVRVRHYSTTGVGDYKITSSFTDSSSSSGGSSSGGVVGFSVSDWELAVVSAGTSHNSIMTTPVDTTTHPTHNLSGMTGSFTATYEFVVNVPQTDQFSPVLLGDNVWWLKFDQERSPSTQVNQLGVTKRNVGDYFFISISGRSLTSPYNRDAHIVYTYDGADTEVFVDGQQVGILYGYGHIFTHAASDLGWSPFLPDSLHNLKGRILAFASYKTVLPDEEIQSHYNAAFPSGTQSPPAAPQPQPTLSPDGDEDNDGLTNAEETHLFAAYNLDHYNADSDGDGTNDGYEDFDSDRVTNIFELRTFNSDPLDAYSLDPNNQVSDSAWLFLAPLDSSSALQLARAWGQIQAGQSSAPITTLLISDHETDTSNGRASIRFTGTTVADGVTYLNFVFTPRNNAEETFDLYFRPGVSGTTYWAWTSHVLPAGQTISVPVSRFASPQGFFTGGSRADTDQDGLTDGFELLVSKTNPTNPDSAVDQNSDPDGDNLPYAAEWKLRTNPNVADNPLTLNNLSDNQQISGTGYVNLNISSLAPSSTTFSLVVDGVVSPDASVEKNGHQWQLVWDTNSTLNGAYTIQLQMQYLHEEDNWGIVRGPAKNVNIGNNLTFGQFFNDEFRPSSLSSVIGSKLIIDAIINNYDESNSPNLAIAFYDEDDVYLGYTIHSPRSFIDQDGNSNWYISSEWDLTTADSTFPSNKNIVGVFYWILTAQLDHNNTPQEITRRVFVRDGGLFDGDDFVAAWGWSPTFWEGRRPMQKHEMIRGGVLNTIGDPLGNLFNRNYVPYTLAPLPENAVVTSAGAANLPTFRFQTGNDKQKLLTALADRKNRNFFFLGHGSPGSLSHSSSERKQIYIPNANQPDVIFAEEIDQALGNPINPPWFFPNDRTKFINHPYRLVILMGCETAVPSWPNAFGISPKESTVQEYLDLGREPRAIVLWEEEILIPLELIPGRSQVLHSRFGYGLHQMFKFWMEGKTIEECMVEFERAANRTTIEEDGLLGIRFSASELFDPFDGLDSWKIYGCKDLRRTKQ